MKKKNDTARKEAKDMEQKERTIREYLGFDKQPVQTNELQQHLTKNNTRQEHNPKEIGSMFWFNRICNIALFERR